MRIEAIHSLTKPHTYTQTDTGTQKHVDPTTRAETSPNRMDSEMTTFEIIFPLKRRLVLIALFYTNVVISQCIYLVISQYP